MSWHVHLGGQSLTEHRIGQKNVVVFSNSFVEMVFFSSQFSVSATHWFRKRITEWKNKKKSTDCEEDYHFLVEAPLTLIRDNDYLDSKENTWSLAPMTNETQYNDVWRHLLNGSFCLPALHLWSASSLKINKPPTVQGLKHGSCIHTSATSMWPNNTSQKYCWEKIRIG